MAIPNIWRTKKQRYSLEATVCPICNTTMFPPRRQCRHCSHTGATATASANEERSNYFLVFALPQRSEVAVAGDD